MLLKIGQLARRTGLTVRTLHHYDAIGLLRPSGRAANGYRVYDRADVVRLHQIQALRRLDLGLDEIAALLAAKEADIGAVVAQQVAQLDAQIRHATLLRARLLRLQEDVAAGADKPDLAEWLVTLELMAVFDQHLTPEETARWRAQVRGEQRDERVRWKTLVADIQALLRERVPAGAPAAQACARRWLELTDPHLKQHPRLTLKLDVLYRDDPMVQAVTGIDTALIDYLTRAAAHYRLGLYARHLAPAQLEAIRERFLAQPNGAWVALTHDLGALMDAGAAPSSPEVQAVCRRWRALFETCYGSDPAIAARILHAQASDPDLALGSSWNPALRAYRDAGLALLDAVEASHA